MNNRVIKCSKCPQNVPAYKASVPHMRNVPALLHEITNGRDFYVTTETLKLVALCPSCSNKIKHTTHQQMFWYESTLQGMQEQLKQAEVEHESAQPFWELNEEFSPKMHGNAKGFLPHLQFIRELLELEEWQQVSEAQLLEFLSTHEYCKAVYGSAKPYYHVVEETIKDNLERGNEDSQEEFNGYLKPRAQTHYTQPTPPKRKQPALFLPSLSIILSSEGIKDNQIIVLQDAMEYGLPKDEALDAYGTNLFTRREIIVQASERNASVREMQEFHAREQRPNRRKILPTGSLFTHI